MQITSQQRLEVLLKRIPYTETFGHIQNFKPKQVCFQDIFYNLDHILYSHICCEWLFYNKDFNNEYIAFFIFQSFHHNQHRNSPKFFIQIFYTLLILTRFPLLMI